MEMGWGIIKGGSDVAHLWVAESGTPQIRRACGKRPNAVYWECRDAEPTDARCPECEEADRIKLSALGRLDIVTPSWTCKEGAND